MVRKRKIKDDEHCRVLHQSLTQSLMMTCDKYFHVALVLFLSTLYIFEVGLKFFDGKQNVDAMEARLALGTT